MAAIYIHIPFCKQACNYCDFHFSTSLKYKDEMVIAIANELALRKMELENELVESIYFGGGTPSILSELQISFLIDEVYKNYTICDKPEITLEANPDDLSSEAILKLSNSKINRLSIGVQSFLERDLKYMNRAHNSTQALDCLKFATQHFDNISVDLIYGTPNLTNKEWLQNINTAVDFGISHISSYALTVEPKTALHKMIATGNTLAPNDNVAREHFEILIDTLEKEEFIHYELSNFGKSDFFSKNNSAYWLGQKYIGVGPSAHSFSGNTRSWNIANNSLYLKSINSTKLPSEFEILSLSDAYNEMVMTGLRTIWGISLDAIRDKFGIKYQKHLENLSSKFITAELLLLENGIVKATNKGKFLVDGIASDLFYLN